MGKRAAVAAAMLTIASVAACSTPRWQAPFARVATPAACLKLQPDDPPRPSLLQLDAVWRTYRIPALSAEVSLPASWDGIVTDPSRSQAELDSVKRRDPEVGSALEPWLGNPSPGDFVAQNGADGPGLNITHNTVPTSESLSCATPKSARQLRAGVKAYRYQFHDGPGAMTVVPITVQGKQVHAVDIVRLRTQGHAQLRTLFVFNVLSGDPMQYVPVFWRIADSLSPLPAGAGRGANPVHACAYLDPKLPGPGQPAGGFCAHPVSDSVLLADCVGGRTVPPDGSVLTPYRLGAGDGGSATLKAGDGHCTGVFPAGNAVSIHARRLATDVLVMVDVVADRAGVGFGLRESTAGSDWVEVDAELGGTIHQQLAGGRPTSLGRADPDFVSGRRLAVLIQSDRLVLYSNGLVAASGTTQLLGEGQIEVYLYPITGYTNGNAGAADVYHIAMYAPV